MTQALDRLLEALKGVQNGPPANVAAFLAGLPDPREMPLPRDAWMLIALFEFRRKRHWATKVYHTHFASCPITPGVLGPQYECVPVPNQPDWKLDGIDEAGLCLTHRENKEVIRIGYVSSNEKYKDSFRFSQIMSDLHRLKWPRIIKIRLKQLLPDRNAIALSLEALDAEGVFFYFSQDRIYPVRLSDQVLEVEQAVEAFFQSWLEPKHRIWLSALIGDWPGAHWLAEGSRKISRITEERRDQSLRWTRHFVRQNEGRSPENDPGGGLYDMKYFFWFVFYLIWPPKNQN